jgi:hypothetical protein
MPFIGKLATPTLALAVLVSACSSGAVQRGSGATAPDPPASVPASPPGPPVRSSTNPRLGVKVLVDRKGLTLYAVT